MNANDLSIVRCPCCSGGLAYKGGTRHGEPVTGALSCTSCGFLGLVRGGMPDLHEEAKVQGPDWWMRLTYNQFAIQHDIGVRFYLPMAQDWVTEDTMRARYMDHLGLERLAPRRDGQPIRILEVGMGTGSNFPLIMRRIPRGVQVELWGCDLSEGMLRRAEKRLSGWKLRGTDGRPVRMLVADAHALPFASGSFDRVIHVGGIGAFRSPMKAMREMARVARPSSEVVVVDEMLDPSKKQGLFHRLWFWNLTALDRHPHPPREGIPFGSTVIADEQITRFYYCLAFRTPPAKPEAAKPEAAKPPAAKTLTPSSSGSRA